MGNEITAAQQGALSAIKGATAGLRRASATAPRGEGGGFMRFGKDGIWSFGQENKEIDGENDFAIVNVASFKEGYVCWSNHDPSTKKKNEKLGEVMQPIANPVDMDTLDDHGWPWARQQSVQVKFCDGQYEGQQVIFNTSSQGGLEMLGNIIDAILERVDADNPYCFPIIAFDHTHYIHKQYGKTYKPVWTIEGWADGNGNEEGAGAPVEEETKQVEAPKEEPKVEDEKPRSRRRSAEPEPEEKSEAVADAEDEGDAKPVSRRRRR